MVKVDLTKKPVDLDGTEIGPQSVGKLIAAVLWGRGAKEDLNVADLCLKLHRDEVLEMSKEDLDKFKKEIADFKFAPAVQVVFDEATNV